MIVPAFDALPPWAMLLSLGVHGALGLLLGAVYFSTLWWNTRRFAEGGRVATSVTLMIARFALLGGLLVLASLEGALPLLVMTLGILVARFAVVRTVRQVLP